jgi:hypothetical protein
MWCMAESLLAFPHEKNLLAPGDRYGGLVDDALPVSQKGCLNRHHAIDASRTGPFKTMILLRRSDQWAGLLIASLLALLLLAMPYGALAQNPFPTRPPGGQLQAFRLFF